MAITQQPENEVLADQLAEVIEVMLNRQAKGVFNAKDLDKWLEILQDLYLDITGMNPWDENEISDDY